MAGVMIEHDQELIRIHELWQHTRNELKTKARELAEAERTRAMELEQVQTEHTNGMREMQAIAIELRDKTRALEAQLQGSREEKVALAEQLQEVQRRAREAQLQLDAAQASSRGHEQRAGELQGSLRALQRERKAAGDKSYDEFRRLEGGLAERELTMGQLEGRLRSAQQEAKAARDEQQLEADRAREQLRRFEDADVANRELSRQLAGAKEQLRFMQVTRRNESQLHAIVDQLQLDNARLVKILSGTAEFKQFVEDADDSAGLSYVAPSASAEIGATLRSDARQRAARPVRGAAAEGEGWVPSDSYTLANEFRHTHAPHASAEAFADLLLRLNAVWRQREQRRVARLKERFREERAHLSRRLRHSVPHDAVAHEVEIERLKRELRAVRLGAGAGRRRLNETEERLFESSLEAVESLSAQVGPRRRAAPASALARASRPPSRLHARLPGLGLPAHAPAARPSARRAATQLAACREKEELMRATSESATAAGARFSDGAASASRKAAEMVDVLSDKLGALVRDFQQKTVELPRDDPDVFIKLVRVQGWFLENLERRLNAARCAARAQLGSHGATSDAPAAPGRTACAISPRMGHAIPLNPPAACPAQRPHPQPVLRDAGRGLRVAGRLLRRGHRRLPAEGRGWRRLRRVLRPCCMCAIQLLRRRISRELAVCYLSSIR